MKHPSLVTSLLATLAGLLVIPAAAHAHEGHGLPGISHWHGTDVLGFVAAGALVVGLIWLHGRK
ncbi:MAG: hypothetical protein KBF81_09290 [Aquabacterium sp.]|jgi:hypothetical protein|nr:hypothetical protein [Aquabacterium sp.]